MNRKRKIVYWILALIPTIAVLVVLTCIHPLLLLVGVIAVLVILLILKRQRPEWFNFRPGNDGDNNGTLPHPPSRSRRPERVYMVLAALGGSDTQRIEVDREKFTIGRAAQNDCVLKGERISRMHLQITYNQQENACYVMDLGSKNGTYLNLERLRSNLNYKLVEGDNLMIDDRPFTVQYAHY